MYKILLFLLLISQGYLACAQVDNSEAVVDSTIKHFVNGGREPSTIKLLESSCTNTKIKQTSCLLANSCMGKYYLERKEFQKGVEVFKRALELTKKIYGEKSVYYLMSLNNLAQIYNFQGDYQKALEVNIKIVDISKEVLGENHPNYLTNLNNLAKNYSDLGDYQKSIEINLKVVEMRKEVLGERDPKYLTSLNNLAVNYYNLGDYQKSLDIYLKLVEIRKEVQGERDPIYLTCLTNLAQLYSNLGDYQKALEIHLKLVEILKEVSGERDPDYLSSLVYLVGCYFKLGDYPKALELNLKLVEIRMEVLGERDPDYLTSLSNLAVCYSKLGDYHKALEINLKVSEMRKEVLGERDPDYLNSLSILASIYSSLGDFHRALEINLKVSEMRKELLGERDPDYLTSLNNLADSYSCLGDYSKSLEINIKVVEAKKEVLGEKDSDYLTSLGNLASNYTYLGDYQKALVINLKAVELGKAVLGERHPDYLTSLNNLAVCYSKLGDYQKSLEINLKLVKISKEELGERHPDYLIRIINLAQDYSNLGDYQKSLELNLKVVELLKEVLGERHSDYLKILNNMAVNYFSLGDYQKSLEINLKVAEILKEVLGENHPDYLNILSNLAVNYSDLGDYHKALEMNLKAVEIRKEVLGEFHPDYLKSLNNLAVNYSDLGDSEKALDISLRLFIVSPKISTRFEYNTFVSNVSWSFLELHKFDSAQYFQIQCDSLIKADVINNFTSMTEKQRGDYWKMYELNLQISPLFYCHDTTINSKYIGQAYNNALFSKGLLLQATRNMDDLLLESGNDSILTLFQNLKIERLQLQRLYEKPTAERDLNTDSLEEKAYQMEKELVARSKTYGDYTKNLKVTWSDVQTKLTDTDVAIEFVEYPNLKQDTLFYAALMLRKNWQAPKMVQLFTKADMEMYSKQDASKIYGKGYVSSQINKLLFTPLLPYINEGDNIYFAAAGLLHNLAIESLPTKDGQLMGDKYSFYRVTSTKELVFKNTNTNNHTSVLYGGLTYDVNVNNMVAESLFYSKDPSFTAMRGFISDTTTRAGWKYLNGTLPEVENISKELKNGRYSYTIYSGAKGNEESFKALSGKQTGIIHIATHGFFITPDKIVEQPFYALHMSRINRVIPRIDPMERSGLLLSGGNRAWIRDTIPCGIEDGVLTAKEISRLDLRGTDLVVLSACETGLGEVSGEGVFGLQRAFKQAGSQTLVMSLWNVSDEATNYMMTTFYKELMLGKSKREAFLSAQNSCRQKYKEPYYWAAFVMLD